MMTIATYKGILMTTDGQTESDTYEPTIQLAQCAKNDDKLRAIGWVQRVKQNVTYWVS